MEPIQIGDFAAISASGVKVETAKAGASGEAFDAVFSPQTPPKTPPQTAMPVMMTLPPSGEVSMPWLMGSVGQIAAPMGAILSSEAAADVNAMAVDHGAGSVPLEAAETGDEAPAGDDRSGGADKEVSGLESLTSITLPAPRFLMPQAAEAQMSFNRAAPIEGPEGGEVAAPVAQSAARDGSASDVANPIWSGKTVPEALIDAPLALPMGAGGEVGSEMAAPRRGDILMPLMARDSQIQNLGGSVGDTSPSAETALQMPHVARSAADMGGQIRADMPQDTPKMTVSQMMPAPTVAAPLTSAPVAFAPISAEATLGVPRTAGSETAAFESADGSYTMPTRPSETPPEPFGRAGQMPVAEAALGARQDFMPIAGASESLPAAPQTPPDQTALPDERAAAPSAQAPTGPIAPPLADAQSDLPNGAITGPKLDASPQAAPRAEDAPRREESEVESGRGREPAVDGARPVDTVASQTSAAPPAERGADTSAARVVGAEDLAGVQSLGAQDRRASIDAPLTPVLHHIDTARADVARSVGQQMAAGLAMQQDRPVELTLSPEELGRVRLSMQSSDQSMVVTVQADRQDTLDLMRRHIESLAREFREMGYSDVSFSFSQNPNRDQAAQQSAEETRPFTDDAPFLARDVSLQSQPIRISLDAGARGLDLRI